MFVCIVDFVPFLQVREIKLAREQEKSNAAQETEELKQKLQRQMQSELMVNNDCSLSFVHDHLFSFMFIVDQS